MKATWVLPSPIGPLTLQVSETALEAIYFGEVDVLGYELKKTKFTERVMTELEEYFEGTRREFTLALSQGGTMFQKKVWMSLREIPYGETRTYKQVAESIGHHRAYRAVGSANNKNQIPIIIPCHRVIGVNGKMAGYAGGIQIKEKLLALEKSFIE